MSLLFPDLGSNVAVPQAKMALVLNSPLWKPVFRHQMRPELGLEASWPTQPQQDRKEVSALLLSFCWEWKVLTNIYHFKL